MVSFLKGAIVVLICVMLIQVIFGIPVYLIKKVIDFVKIREERKDELIQAQIDYYKSQTDKGI